MSSGCSTASNFDPKRHQNTTVQFVFELDKESMQLHICKIIEGGQTVVLVDRQNVDSELRIESKLIKLEYQAGIVSV